MAAVGGALQLLPEHGCCSFRAAANPYGWLSRFYFLFPTFSF
jgi:hypothetical protein